MSKIKSLYINNVDKVWYDSSNILYSECDDIVDSLKTLRVFFKNGRVYQYYEVNVNDYLLFRESDSQGKALTKFIKQYKAERLDDFNVDEIKDQLEELFDEDKKPNKEELFDNLFNISMQIENIANALKTIDLNENELAYVSFAITNISKHLMLTKFTNNDINFININDKIDTLMKSFKDKNKEYNILQLNNFFKNNLL